jgi:hypothetical protein
MPGMDGEIERVLQAPTEVRLSRADDNVRLFYEFYLTETIKAGETLWPRK